MKVAKVDIVEERKHHAATWAGHVYSLVISQRCILCGGLNAREDCYPICTMCKAAYDLTAALKKSSKKNRK
jgi:hypothetical protein